MKEELLVAILCDNLVNRLGLLAEHGFSVLVQLRGSRGPKRVLFDAGQGLTLLHNARILQFDLHTIGAVVLSHGHYDHTGGLKELTRLRGGFPVFAHPEIFKQKYQEEEKGRRKTGIPWQKRELEEQGVEFFLTRESQEIVPGVLLSGETASPAKGRGLAGALVEEGGQLVADYFLDEIALFILTSRGVVVLTGCSHPGLERILSAAVSVTGTERIFGLIGGFHLAKGSQEEIKATSCLIRQFGIKEVVMCHCTGYRAYEIFRKELGFGCHMGEVGFIWSC